MSEEKTGLPEHAKAKNKKEAKKKIKKYWDYYFMFSDKLSSVCRQLAFAEGGAYWIIQQNFKKTFSPTLLFIFFLLLILYFVCDAFQYYFGMRNYEKLGEEFSKKFNDNPEIHPSEINNKCANEKIELFLKMKLIFIFVASILWAIIFINTLTCNK